MSARRWIVAAVVVAGVFVPPVFSQQWRERIEAALENKASYDFRNIAVVDVTMMLSEDSGVNIVLDSPLGLEGGRKLTFKISDMSYGNILTWFGRLLGAEWVIQDEAVFIVPLERLDAAAKLLLESRAQRRRTRAEKTWLPEFRRILGEPNSVNFKGRRLREAAESLAALFDLNVLVSPEADERVQVTLAVSEMSGENIIAWVARKAGVDYAVVDEAIYIAPVVRIRALRAAGLDFSSRGRPYELVTFDFRDVPLEEALSQLAAKTDAEIVLRSDTDDLPRVTLSGTDMVLTEAVRAVTHATGLNTAIIAESGTIFVSVLGIVEAPPEPPAPAGEEETGAAERKAGPEERQIERKAEPREPGEARTAPE
ncbi:MAG: hypothetical protein ACYTAN_10185 [Planctomycetota bacterium]|jgi:hypothetical protein